MSQKFSVTEQARSLGIFHFLAQTKAIVPETGIYV